MPISRLEEKDSAILLATYHLQRAKLLAEAISEAARGPEAQTLQARMRFLNAEIDMAADLLEATQT